MKVSKEELEAKTEELNKRFIQELKMMTGENPFEDKGLKDYETDISTIGGINEKENLTINRAEIYEREVIKREYVEHSEDGWIATIRDLVVAINERIVYELIAIKMYEADIVKYQTRATQRDLYKIQQIQIKLRLEKIYLRQYIDLRSYMQQQVWNNLAGKSDTYKIVWWNYVALGFGTGYIASHLGIPQPTVNKIVAKIKKLMGSEEIKDVYVEE